MPLLLLLTVSCKTQQFGYSQPKVTRTPYQAFTSDLGGYWDEDLGEGRYKSTFSGNGFTNSQDAEYFAVFRAFQFCRERDHILADIYNVQNKSEVSSVNRTANMSFQNPTYTTVSNRQLSPFEQGYYGTNNSNAIQTQTYGGGSLGGSYSWKQNITKPMFEVYYSCIDEMKRFGFNLKYLQNSEVKHVTKDFLGAILVTEIKLDMNSSLKSLKVGDLIVRVNGERVYDQKSFDEHKNLHSQNKVKVRVYRDQKFKNIYIKAMDITQKAINQYQALVRTVCTVPEISNNSDCYSRDLAQIKDFDREDEGYNCFLPEHKNKQECKEE